MLVELWEKFRGYDRWTDTNARIGPLVSHKKASKGRSGQWVYGYRFERSLQWVDQQGQSRNAKFKLPDDSPLFQVRSGELVTIRYDPVKPEHFYFRDLFQFRIHSGFRTAIGLGLSVVGPLAAVLLFERLQQR